MFENENFTVKVNLENLSLSDDLLPESATVCIGCLTNDEYVKKLANFASDATNFDATRSSSYHDSSPNESENIEYFLEHITFNNNTNIDQLIDHRKKYYIYEDYFNHTLFDIIKTKLSFEQLKTICDQYLKENQQGIDINNIIDEHKKITTRSTYYFIGKGLSEDDVQSAAFVLSFYTRIKNNSNDNLLSFQINKQMIEERINDETVILYYLVKSLAYIPYYQGNVTKICQLNDEELKLYIPGCLITWTQFSSSTRNEKIIDNFDCSTKNIIFKIYSLTGRLINEFSNFPEEDEVLFLPYSTFFVIKHECRLHGSQHVIYMRQIELGLSERSVLWVDDRIFVEGWDHKDFIESATAKGLNNNVHFIKKSSTWDAISFLRSSFGQRLKNKDTFRIVTDMHRENEDPAYNAGARLIKQLRQLGFRNYCLIYTGNWYEVEKIVRSELNAKEQQWVPITGNKADLKRFLNFEM